MTDLNNEIDELEVTSSVQEPDDAIDEIYDDSEIKTEAQHDDLIEEAESEEDKELEKIAEKRKMISEENEARSEKISKLSEISDSLYETNEVIDTDLHHGLRNEGENKQNEESLELHAHATIFDEEPKAISPIVFDRHPVPRPLPRSPTPDAAVLEAYFKSLKSLFHDAAYFLMKSGNYENVSLAKAKGVWSTPFYNQSRIDRAYKECQNVILIFSVKESRCFQGFARVSARSTEDYPQVRWVLPPGMNLSKLKRVIKLDWISRRELAFERVKHLYNSWNENKPVKIGMDGQDVEPNCAEAVCRMFPIDEQIDLESIERRSKRHVPRKLSRSPSPRPHHPHRNRSLDFPHRRSGGYRGSDRYPIQNRLEDGFNDQATQEILLNGSYDDYVRGFYQDQTALSQYAHPNAYGSNYNYRSDNYSRSGHQENRSKASSSQYEQDVADFLKKTTGGNDEDLTSSGSNEDDRTSSHSNTDRPSRGSSRTSPRYQRDRDMRREDVDYRHHHSSSDRYSHRSFHSDRFSRHR